MFSPIGKREAEGESASFFQYLGIEQGNCCIHLDIFWLVGAARKVVQGSCGTAFISGIRKEMHDDARSEWSRFGHGKGVAWNSACMNENYSQLPR